MNIKAQLFEFEEKYPFLYNEIVGGVSVYTCLRDGVVACLSSDIKETNSNVGTQKGEIFIRRLLGTFLRWRKFRKAETVVFTSSVYRRDNGRNLATEFLLDKYPNGVVFEWPSRNESFDKAYFSDRLNYVPLDGYLIRYKIYCKLHKKKIQSLENQCRERLLNEFNKNPPTTAEHKRAVDYLIEELPRSVVATKVSQRIFARMFRKYKNVKYAIDFWGSGRENIIPVLQGKPKSIELQHGIITPVHPGYVYPEFVKEINSSLFKRTILVYDNRYKEILCNESIYKPEQIEIVGNPRIQTYKKLFATKKSEKKWVLFTSQSYEQDQPGVVYYEKMIPYLQEFSKLLEKDGCYKLAIKLHPRENEGVKELYEKAIPNAVVFGASSPLYELLNETYLHITATSTVVVEALEFGVPSFAIDYEKVRANDLFGIDIKNISDVMQIKDLWKNILDETNYSNYIKRLKN